MRFLLATMLAACGPAVAGALPDGFVRLSDIDPTIRQEMNYAGSLNFLGRAARGYEAPVCILSKEAADALAAVQQKLKAEGLSLVLFDCYRPVRAVSDFAAWARLSGGTNPRWHPSVARNRLIREGYIASKSAHSRGSTVDIGIAPLNGPGAAAPACGADNDTLDFGTGFDCLDPSSNTDSRAVSAEARANRRKLVAAMREAGFRNYSAEWWHFTLDGEPFRKPYDFLVTRK